MIHFTPITSFSSEEAIDSCAKKNKEEQFEDEFAPSHFCRSQQSLLHGKLFFKNILLKKDQSNVFLKRLFLEAKGLSIKF